MIGKIYRIQAYISWAVVGGLFLLIEFGDIAWLRSMAASGVLSIWTAMAWIRTILPVGTVLAILAGRKGMKTRHLLICQLVTLLINLTVFYTVICAMVIISGGA
ncbi:MAG: hypothetical protein IKK57_10160 [Clostridia bacterium]|nr:hypothetical protein [Clostridia bacterium]